MATIYQLLHIIIAAQKQDNPVYIFLMDSHKAFDRTELDRDAQDYLCFLILQSNHHPLPVQSQPTPK